MTASKIIKKMRINMYMTQSEFADKLKISQFAISQYERGLGLPKLKIIKKLIELGKENNISLTIDDFFS